MHDRREPLKNRAGTWECVLQDHPELAERDYARCLELVLQENTEYNYDLAASSVQGRIRRSLGQQGVTHLNEEVEQEGHVGADLAPLDALCRDRRYSSRDGPTLCLCSVTLGGCSLLVDEETSIANSGVRSTCHRLHAWSWAPHVRQANPVAGARRSWRTAS